MPSTPPGGRDVGRDPDQAPISTRHRRPIWPRQDREAKGFLDRTPHKKPGSKPSPRTHQLHPKVGEAIAAEAEKLGIIQGQLIEQMGENLQHSPVSDRPPAKKRIMLAFYASIYYIT